MSQPIPEHLPETDWQKHWVDAHLPRWIAYRRGASVMYRHARESDAILVAPEPDSAATLRALEAQIAEFAHLLPLPTMETQ